MRVRKCKMVPRYFVLVCCMASFNMFLLFRQFSTTKESGSALYDITSLSSSKCICDCNCQKEHLDLQIKTNAILDELAKLKQLIPKETQKKFMEHEKQIQAIVSKTNGEINRDVIHTEKSQGVLKYSCPETYNGSTFGYPYFTKGFLRVKCSNRMEISKSTSLILDRPQTSDEQLENMLKYATVMFSKIIVILNQNVNYKFTHHYRSVTVIRVKDANTFGSYLNMAVKYIDTPLTLVAPFLAKFDNSSDLERLFHVLDLSNGDIVGSAVKDVSTGEWDRGCYQTSLKLYILKYNKGYFNSRHECLYCNYLVSPFLVRSGLLKKVPFRHFPGGVYRDYFLQMKMLFKTVLACPDVMFYTKKPVTIENKLVKFVKTWNIKKIIEADNTVRWYGCRRSDTSRCSTKRSLAVPPCCRANLADAIKFIHDQCIINNITCELQEGTLMGAIKFNDILLWERDADITVLSADFHRFEQLSSVFAKRGYRMTLVSKPFCCFEKVVSGGVMRIQASGWTIEIYGQHKLTTEKMNTRTKVKLSNKWVYTPENPGLYIRNRYGSEIYQHAEHWMTTGKKSGWEKYDTGKFRKCDIPGNHGCLDQYFGDGDIQFMGLL